MPARRLLAALLLLATVPASLGSCSPPPAQSESQAAQADAAGGQRSNLVVVIGCTVRKDQLTPYGGAPQNTPFLAALAAQGARFTDTVAASSWTRESTTAMLSGRFAASWGQVEPDPGPSHRPVPAAAVLLAERLKANGYLTLGVTANPNLSSALGYDQGFDSYLEPEIGGREGFEHEHRLSGREVVQLAEQLLDDRTPAQRQQPFYLQLVMMDPHWPRQISDDERVRFKGDGSVPRRLVEYRATLRRLDDAIGALDESLLKRLAGPTNTFLVFIADHGESLKLAAGRLMGHGGDLYPSTTCAPWLVRGPGVPPGHVVPGLASHLDFSPTMLGLLGLPNDEFSDARDWSGRLLGDPTTTTRQRAFSASMFFGTDIAAIWTPTRQCQLDYGSVPKVTITEGCFDRRADPTFTTPLKDAELVAELKAWRAARMVEYATWDEPTVVLDPALESQLKALGYVEDP
jgi:arylsulfatase A-like enzyme